jgi:hypothetical protein
LPLGSVTCLCEAGGLDPVKYGAMRGVISVLSDDVPGLGKDRSAVLLVRAVVPWF